MPTLTAAPPSSNATSATGNISSTTTPVTNPITPKIYKTRTEQLNILRSRGLNIDDDTIAEEILEKENYYNVINGYKEPFIDLSAASENYLPNAKFDELFSVFTFDRNIRMIYLKYILKAEHHLKTVIAHEFSKLYGYDNYLKIENFDTSTNIKLKEVLQTIGSLNTVLSNQLNKSKEITHYLTTHGYVPLWVMVNVLTLGELSHFFKNLKPQDANAIAKTFNIRHDELSKFMKNLTIARNICAHDERFYDIKFKAAISSKQISNFNVFQIPVTSGTPTYGIRDIFSIAIILALLLPKKDIQEFIDSMENEFNILNSSLCSISGNNIMLEMGFGSNWKLLSAL